MALCIHSQGHKYVFPRLYIIDIFMSLLYTDNAKGVSRSKEKHFTSASLRVKWKGKKSQQQNKRIGCTLKILTEMAKTEGLK